MDIDVKSEREKNGNFLKEYTEFRRVVICPICLSNFTHPITLSCAHTFCSHCIASAVDVREACPLCSVAVEKKQLVENEQLSNIWNAIGTLINLIQPANFNDQIPTSHIYKARSPAASSSSSAVNRRGEIQAELHTNSTSAVVVAPPVIETVSFVPPVDITASLKPGILVNVLKRTWAGISYFRFKKLK